MKKTILLSIVFLGLTSSQAYVQAFAEIPTTITSVNGNAEWGDYYKDGDSGLIAVGDTVFNGLIPKSTKKLYQNDRNSFPSGITYSGSGYRRVVEYGNMKNNNSFVLNSSLSAGVFAMDGFTELGAGLTGAGEGTVDFIDYDNDGDLDAVVSGYSGSVYSTKIYDNDGSGNFTDNSKGLPAGISGMIAWSDYDNDGDMDAAVTGYLSGGEYTRIYQNTGGTFTDISAGLDSLNHGFLAWGDYDNDGDDDLFLSGNDGTNRVTDIYENNNGVFTAISAGLTPVDWSYAAWGDYDNDGDLDIAVHGHFDGGSRTTNIYENTDGSFTDISAGIPGLAAGSFAWGDYDGDGDLDLALSGFTVSGRISRIYQNTGGSFTDISAGLGAVERGSTEWGDYDNDGDLDLLLTGDLSGSNITAIYENDNGTFSNINAGFTALYTGRGVFGDIDNDGDLDVLVSGYDGSIRHAKIYVNNRTATNTAPGIPSGLSATSSGTSATLSWTKATDTETTQDALTYNVRIGTTSGGSDILSGMSDTGTGFRRMAALGNSGLRDSLVINDLSIGTTYYWSVQAIDNAFEGSAFAIEGTFVAEGFVDASAGLYASRYGSVDWNDYDNDGDKDLLITGNSNTVLYKNTAGSFSSVATSLPGMSNSDAAWGDYDGDGDLDVAVVGRNSSSEIISKIFRNDGGDTFTDISAGLTGVRYASVDWGDYDNDGDLDLLLAGHDGSSVHAKVYQNNSGNFSGISAGFTGVYFAYVKWVDIDSDNDLDAVVFGYDLSFNEISNVYRNDSGSFTAITSNLPGISDAKPAFGDFDNDGDIDMALAHFTNSGVYHNNGSGSFTKVWTATNLSYGLAAAGDYDNDGDLDVLMAGWIQSPSQRVARVYRNDGSATFTDISAGLNGVQQGAAAWGDYDGDNDLDLVVLGTNGSTSSTTLYQNHRNTPNTAPSTPSELVMIPGVGSITFSWAAASDAEGGPLSYNVFMSNVDSSSSVVSGMSDTGTGFRRVTGPGNAGQTTSFEIDTTGLPDGLHTWGVQTIDGAGGSSAFTTHSFLHGTDGAVLTGTDGWRLLAMPATSPTFSSMLPSLWTQGFTGASATIGSSNVYTWSIANATDDLSNWTVPGSLSESLPTGKGALVYVYSDDNGPNIVGDAGFPKSMPFNGTEPTGTIDLSALLNANTSGRALLGNPFQSDIYWDLVSKTNLSNVVYVWDHNASAWKSWNGTVGTLTDGIIPAYNGFFVQTLSSSPALSIPEAAKVSGQRGMLGKAVAQKQGQPKALKLHAVSGGLSADAWISFQAGGEEHKDRFDALAFTSLSNNYLQLATQSPNSDEMLSINALPLQISERIVLPLKSLGSGVPGSATLSFEGLEAFEGWDISLRDNQTGETYPVEEGTTLELDVQLIKAKSVSQSKLVAPVAVKVKASGTRYEVILQPGVNVSIEDPAGLPIEVALEQNYPNPFNPSTTIAFGVPQTSKVTLEVFDMLGRKVATLLNGENTAAGRYTVNFDASRLASGMYIYRLQAGATIITKKLTLIK